MQNIEMEVLKAFDTEIFKAFDIDSAEGFTLDLAHEATQEKRIMKPRLKRPVKCAYTNAQEFAKNIALQPGVNYYCIVAGDFIFGDIFEALLVDGDVTVKNLDIATLSMSQDNVDSLRTIMDLGYCYKLNLIISHFFYSHERNGLIPYIYKELDRGERFQLAVAGTHCKIACFETIDGLKFTLHGSANLRTNANIEQFMLTEDAELYDFNMLYMRELCQQYKTIRQAAAEKQKPPHGRIAGRGKSWHLVQRAVEALAAVAREQKAPRGLKEEGR